MSKAKSSSSVATMEPPVKPEVKSKANYRVRFTAHWLPMNLVLEGCESEQQAREFLHLMLDDAIGNIEKER